jgi:hypothetical protein
VFVTTLFLNEPPHLNMKFKNTEIVSSHQTMDSTLSIPLISF